VYEMALTELSRFLPRHDNRSRYLRGGTQHTAQEHGNRPKQYGAAMNMELPPGATFDPDPQAALRQHRDGS
jgi:putative (di)nucleoside polyphosphate hydrolase